jgi:hypothetical protein
LLEEEQPVSYIVTNQDSDGRAGYHEFEELGAAVTHVEHLRNTDGVEHARIFRMQEVSFEFRPYYRVEIGDSTPATTIIEYRDADEKKTDAPIDAVVDAAVGAAIEAAMESRPAVWDGAPGESSDSTESDDSDGVGTDPALPPEPALAIEPAGNTRRGLFGR